MVHDKLNMNSLRTAQIINMKARRSKSRSKFSPAGAQLFRMLARNNGSEIMAPEDYECNDALVAAALDISKQLSLKEVLLKPEIPDLGNGDLGLVPSCVSSDLSWYRPRYKKRSVDETNHGWQYEPQETNEVEFLGVEKKKKENQGLMDVWMDSDDHAELLRLNDMLTPDIEIVWEGKANPGLPDDKSKEQTGHENSHAVVKEQVERVEVNKKGPVCRGQRPAKRTVVLPQTRRSTRNLRSNLRFLPRLSVTMSQKAKKQ